MSLSCLSVHRSESAIPDGEGEETGNLHIADHAPYQDAPRFTEAMQ